MRRRWVHHAHRTWHAERVGCAAQLADDARLTSVKLTSLHESRGGQRAVVQHALPAQISQCAESHVPQRAMPLPRTLNRVRVDSSSARVVLLIEVIQAIAQSGRENKMA